MAGRDTSFRPEATRFRATSTKHCAAQESAKECDPLGANPLLGVFLHWLGGLASASFYVPYRQVRGWSWETYWLAGGMVSWIVVPWLMAGLLTHDLLPVLHNAPASTHFVVIFLRRSMGNGRTDLRTDHALSRAFARHGRGAWIHRGLRNAGSAYLPWSVHAVAHATLGHHHPGGRRHLPARDSVCGRGGYLKGERALA